MSADVGLTYNRAPSGNNPTTVCIRYTTGADAATAHRWSLATPWPHEVASANVSPSQQVPVIVVRAGVRVGDFMRWGLIPHWWYGEPPKHSTINARAETIELVPSYKDAWARGQRCILPATAFYVGTPRIGLSGDEHFGLAGLWDAPADVDGGSCAAITVQHMPAIITPETAETWLQGSTDAARSLLVPYPAERLVSSSHDDDPAVA